MRSEVRAQQRLAAGGAAPPTRMKCASYFAGDAIVRQMTRLQWIYVIVGLVVVVAMVIPMFATGR